jgi:hypothetical protein
VGVTDDGIGDVAQQSPSQPAETAATHHDQVGADLLDQVDDRLVPPLAKLEVRYGDDTARLLDLPDLLVQDFLSLLPDGFTPLLGLCIKFVDSLRERATDGYDVELRVGALSQGDRLHGCQLCVRGPIGGQQYPGGEGAWTGAEDSDQPAAFVTVTSGGLHGGESESNEHVEDRHAGEELSGTGGTEPTLLLLSVFAAVTLALGVALIARLRKS